MAKNKYIDAQTFKDFVVNQDRLIEVLNHRTDTLQTSINKINNSITELAVETNWLKKILWAIFSVTAISWVTSLMISLR